VAGAKPVTCAERRQAVIGVTAGARGLRHPGDRQNQGAPVMDTDIRELSAAELDQISGAALNAYLKLKGQRTGDIAGSGGTFAAAALAGAREAARQK
jgi:hypothetical protein